MIIIRFITGAGGNILAVFLILLTVVVVIVVGKENRHPSVYQGTCEFGIYDFGKNTGWEPAENGQFPSISNPSQSGVDYAVKVTITNTSDMILHSGGFTPDPAMLPDNTWQVVDNPNWPSSDAVLNPGESIFEYEPLWRGNGSDPTPTGCTVSSDIFHG